MTTSAKAHDASPAPESSPQLSGLDMALALSLLGIIYSHLRSPFARNGIEESLLLLTNGIPAAHFVMGTGVIVGLMSIRGVSLGGYELAKTRHLLAIRGLLIFFIGVGLLCLQNVVNIVLIPVALAFIILCFFIRTSTLGIFGLLALLLTVGPLTAAAFPSTAIIGQPFPVLTWLTYAVAGFLLSRLIILDANRQFITTIIGTSLALPGLLVRQYFAVSSYDQALQPLSARASAYLELDPFPMRVVSASAHTGGLIDVLTCIGSGVFLISCCLLLCSHPLSCKLLYPFRALGSMVLSAYVVHVFVLAYLFGGVTGVNINDLSAREVTVVRGLDGQISDHRMDDKLPDWEEYRQWAMTSSSWAEMWQKEEQYWNRVDAEHNRSAELYAPRDSPADQPRKITFILSLILMLVIPSLLRIIFRRGPIEYLIDRISTRATRTTRPGVKVYSDPTEQETAANIVYER